MVSLPHWLMVSLPHDLSITVFFMPSWLPSIWGISPAWGKPPFSGHIPQPVFSIATSRVSSLPFLHNPWPAAPLIMPYSITYWLFLLYRQTFPFFWLLPHGIKDCSGISHKLKNHSLDILIFQFYSLKLSASKIIFPQVTTLSYLFFTARLLRLCFILMVPTTVSQLKCLLSLCY